MQRRAAMEPGDVCFLSVSLDDGGVVHSEGVFVRPWSRGRCLVALPHEAAGPLGLQDHLVSVGAACGEKEMQVVTVLSLASGVRRERPRAWKSWLAWPAVASGRPEIEALLELERVSANPVSTDSSAPESPRPARGGPPGGSKASSTRAASQPARASPG